VSQLLLMHSWSSSSGNTACHFGNIFGKSHTLQVLSPGKFAPCIYCYITRTPRAQRSVYWH